jgi:hypothetical protein
MPKYNIKLTDLVDLIHNIKCQDHELGCLLEKDIVIDQKTGKLSYTDKIITDILGKRIIIVD